MSLALSDLLRSTAENWLKACLGWLDKWQDHDSDEQAATRLLSDRLAPDMFPLATQFRVIAFQCRETLLLLQNMDVPADVRGVDPSTVAEVRTLLEDTLAAVRKADRQAIDAADDRAITLTLPMGMSFAMTGRTLVLEWLLPQLAFHASIAYALLRRDGVPLGKKDVVPHLFDRLRSSPDPDLA